MDLIAYHLRLIRRVPPHCGHPEPTTDSKYDPILLPATPITRDSLISPVPLFADPATLPSLSPPITPLEMLHRLQIPTTVYDMFSPQTPPRSNDGSSDGLEGVNEGWVPSTSAGHLLGALEEETSSSSSEYLSGRDEEVFVYDNSAQNNYFTTQSYYTPPTAPSRPERGRSSTSFPFSLDSPPHSTSRTTARINSFDRVVGSPPRSTSRSSTTTQSFNSLPITPSHSESRDETRSIPWTWPLRGASSVDWFSRRSPSPESEIERRLNLKEDKGRATMELATRYVYVEGVPLDSNEQDIKSLFHGGEKSLRGCFSALLRTHGIIVLVFFDVMKAFECVRYLREMRKSVRNVYCISRESLHAMNEGQPNPLISQSEGVVVVTSEGPPGFIVPYLHSLGLTRSTKHIDSQTVVVEYWDERIAERVARTLHGKVEGGTRFRVNFEPGVATTTMEREPDLVLSSSPRSYAAPTPPSMRSPVASGSVHRVDRTYRSTKIPQDVPTPPLPLSYTTPQPKKKAQDHLDTKNGGTQWGIFRDEKIPTNNVLHFDRIQAGLDLRTTLMIKNIPNRMTDDVLMSFIEEVVGRAFDFVYLRIDWRSDCNTGYGFVNFTSTDSLLRFARARLGTRWNLYQSDKLCVASYANIQGKENLVNRFKDSHILEQAVSFQPKIFYSSGPSAGLPEPFPESTDPRRKARSNANAQIQGLYPASKPVFRVTQALKGIHI